MPIVIVNVLYYLHPASRWFVFNEHIETTIRTLVGRVSPSVKSAIFTPLLRGTSNAPDTAG